jgi:acyl carrier protein
VAQSTGTTNTTAKGNEFSDDLLRLIKSLLGEIRPEENTGSNITLDSTLSRDLGLDSLSRVELLSRIERHFGVTLPEAVFTEAETPRDLIREISKASTRGISALPPTATSMAPLKQITETPAQAQTLIEVLEWHVQAHPTRPHIQLYADEGEGAVITYQQLYQQSQIVAANLQQLGLQPGEAVAIMLPTGADYFFTFFGILLAGGIPVPIYPPTRPSQLEDHLHRHATILTNCRAVILITIPAAKRVARLLKSQLEILKDIVTVDELLIANDQFIAPSVSPQDTAFLQYTSGSTGNPKGVVLSHANLLTNIRVMGERGHANSNDVFVSWLPLYHDMGLIGAWLGSLYFAVLFVVMSPLSFLTRPQRWLQAIHRYHGTLSAAPNFGYELCLHRLDDNDLKGLDLSSWRAAFNGAEAVSPQTVMQFIERFQTYGFAEKSMMPVYGLAECSVGLAFPPLGRGVHIDAIQRKPFMQQGVAIPADEDDTNALRFVACGHPLSGHEIRIVDTQGNELSERQEGRLEFRGPSATSGYLRNQAANRMLFDGDWLDSGDLAYLSEGELYVTGRTKDIIIRGGRNLYPHELEEAVGNIPGLRNGRVAVFGATNPATGTERLIVLAESRERKPATLATLREQVNAIAIDLIGDPADEVIIAPPNTVLKTSSGKIRRSACRELYERGFIGKKQAPAWQQMSRLLLTSVAPQLRRFRRAVGSGMWSRYAQTVFGMLAPLSWLLVVLSPSEAFRWQTMRVAIRLLTWLTRTPFRIDGREQLPDKQQACIFVANHASYLDGPLLVAAINRPFSFIAKAELERQFIAGTFLQRIGSSFVERFDLKKGVDDIQQIAHMAQADRSLFFFPEGTFTRVPGLLPFHLGAFLTAAKTGLPIVPIAIRGSRSILRGSTKRPQRSAIAISIGEPIFPQLATKDTWDQAIALRDAARAHILRHCGEPDLGTERNPLDQADSDDRTDEHAGEHTRE